METICPFADYRPIGANTGGPMAEIRGIAPHGQAGYGSLFNMFSDPAREASTHLWIARSGGIEQYVPLTVQAWAHAIGNPYYWSFELEGMSYNDDRGMEGDPLTSQQIDSAGRVMAWMYRQSPTFPIAINSTPGVNGRGITAHRTITKGTKWATACPGLLRLSQFPELVLSTLRHLDGTPPGDDDLTPEQAQQLKDLHAWMSGQKTNPPLQQDGKIVHAGNLVGTLQTSLKEVADSIVKRLKP